MRVLRSLESLTVPLPAPALTIGNFDGVHRGHQRILQSVVEAARRRGTAVAMTFEPHPARVLSPERAPPLLTTFEQKMALLEELGVEVALVVGFTRELSQLTPRAFVEEIIHRRLGAQVVCVGRNFRFGHRQAGDVRALHELGREFRFAVQVIPPVVVGGEVVSSSAVRRLLGEGDVARVARLLGRPYGLTGEVKRGGGRGQALHFPTLNMQPEQECLPARGVYATETVIAGRAYASATNVGVRPTFDGARTGAVLHTPLTVESHLLDFSEPVERGRLETRFFLRLRGEQKFPSPAALRTQIGVDVKKVRRFFARRAAARRQKFAARK